VAPDREPETGRSADAFPIEVSRFFQRHTAVFISLVPIVIVVLRVKRVSKFAGVRAGAGMTLSPAIGPPPHEPRRHHPGRHAQVLLWVDLPPAPPRERRVGSGQRLWRGVTEAHRPGADVVSEREDGVSAQTDGQKTIAFVLYPGLTPLDLIGPLQVLSALALVDPRFRTTVVAERVDQMPSDTPVSLTPEGVFGDEPAPFAILVPGGGAPTIRALANPAIVDYVQSVAQSAELVTSVCTGSLILAAAGLLEGRRATTHWAYAGILERLGATYVRERWVEDGKHLTSAGVSAGIDMALHLTERLAGADIARLVQLVIEYDPQPPAGPIDWENADVPGITALYMASVKASLADRPDLIERLID
jgi:putative intracellular protease/amidase